MKQEAHKPPLITPAFFCFDLIDFFAFFCFECCSGEIYFQFYAEGAVGARRTRRSCVGSRGDVFQVLGLVHVSGHFDFEEARQSALFAHQPVRVLFPAHRAPASNKQATRRGKASVIHTPSRAASRIAPVRSRGRKHKSERK